MTSSGYGSQAVSTLTLSSEDSASIKSIEENTESSRQHSALQSLDSDDLGENQHPREDDEKHTAREHAGKEGDSGMIMKMEDSRNIAYLGENSHSDATGKADSFSEHKTGGQEQRRGEPRVGKDDLTAVDDLENTKQQEQYSGRCSVEADNDPYSVNAMEELEKLGEEDEGDDEDADLEGSGKFTEPEVKSHIVQKPSPKTVQNEAKTTVTSASTVPEPQKEKNTEIKTKTTKASFLSPSTTQNKGDKSPGDKKNANNKRKSAGVRPRPMSMIVSPQVEMMTRAWQEGGYCVDSNSSEEHLSG